VRQGGKRKLNCSSKGHKGTEEGLWRLLTLPCYVDAWEDAEHMYCSGRSWWQNCL